MFLYSSCRILKRNFLRVTKAPYDWLEFQTTLRGLCPEKISFGRCGDAWRQRRTMERKVYSFEVLVEAERRPSWSMSCGWDEMRNKKSNFSLFVIYLTLWGFRFEGFWMMYPLDKGLLSKQDICIKRVCKSCNRYQYNMKYYKHLSRIGHGYLLCLISRFIRDYTVVYCVEVRTRFFNLMS